MRFAAQAGFAPDPEARVHAFCHAVPDTWHTMGVMLSAAGALAWLRNATAPGVEVGDLDAAFPGDDARVLARDHVLDEHHVEVAGTANHDLPLHAEGKLSPLVFPGDEPEREVWRGHAVGSQLIHENRRILV